MFKNVFKLCSLNRPGIRLNLRRNAGHSKWQNIRHTKAANDAARSTLFLKLSRQMKVAITEGGSTDAKKNPKLENVVEQAKRLNMPNATIQSVIRSCENDKSNSKPYMLEIKYWHYGNVGPGGCIVLCEVYTSNLHALRQTISTILRKTLSKYSDGGGMHLFEEKGIIEAELDGAKPVDQLFEVATEDAIVSGAEDVKVLEEEKKLNYKITSASTEYIPLKFQELGDEDIKLCVSLYDKLEALPEVVRLSNNIA